MSSSSSSSSSTSSVSSSSSPPIDETLALTLTLTLNLTLIPGLPNDVSALILSMIPYSCLARLKSISKSWKLFLSSKTLISLRQNNHQSQLLCLFPQDPAIANPFLFDPKTLAWCPLPPLPINPYVYGLCNFTSISLGPNLYVLGGSLFDTRSFPLDRPSPSSSVFRFNFLTYSWELLSPMLSPRGSFACVALPNSDQIIVAGGGSRHTMFGAAGSRMSSVERYDVEKDEWVSLDGLPRFRAGCVGFLIGNGEEKEFWVMGVMELKKGGKWRELGDMWEAGERMRLGKIVVVDDEVGGAPAIFMLDGSEIFSEHLGILATVGAASAFRLEPGIPPLGQLVR
ncbi:F-box/kelch-repeat protein OR23 [Vitis vinifera]|uniref:F-box/kelch-repeat protein OR23 n=1 Tax=Vitis vinifera TaxID=29760 RepID=A0A438KDG0_VITVI|nr:F-box/kelch-repeat protein OR23 [Vitis vinifera]